jgi:hypothetical protein
MRNCDIVCADVPERPGRPAVVQVAAQELIAIWEAPRFDGNCPILYYRVDYKPRGEGAFLLVLAHWDTFYFTTSDTQKILYICAHILNASI